MLRRSIYCIQVDRVQSRCGQPRCLASNYRQQNEHQYRRLGRRNQSSGGFESWKEQYEHDKWNKAFEAGNPLSSGYHESSASRTRHLKALQLDPATLARAPRPEEIKHAYRRLVLEHHPDKGGNRVVFDRVVAAYEALVDDVGDHAMHPLSASQSSTARHTPVSLGRMLSKFAGEGEHAKVWAVWRDLVSMGQPVFPLVFASLTQVAYEEGNVAKARECIADAVKNGLTADGDDGHIAAWNAHFDELVRLGCDMEHAMAAVDAMEAVGLQPSIEMLHKLFT
jgi:hypothetical protein